MYHKDMKQHKILQMDRELKLTRNKKPNKSVKSRHIKHLIVPAVGLFLCICVLKNFKQDIQTNNEKVKQAHQRKMLYGTANVLDKEIIQKTQPVAQRKFLNQNYENMENDRFKNAPNLSRHRQDGNKKTKLMRRMIRDTNRSSYHTEAAQTQIENATQAATPDITQPNYDYATAIKCQQYQNNCTLNCFNGSVSFLNKDINDFKPRCLNSDLSLIVTKCEFISGILQQSFFHSATAMTLLAINECNLQTIKETAFEHKNARSLQTLILNRNQLLTLSDATFEGLINLDHFEFVQNPLKPTFKGEAFLRPLAKKLEEAVIQPQVNGSEKMNPSSWWRDLEMGSLKKLDLSHNNLRGVLDSTTFQALVKLQVLKLCHCNLSSFTADVFDFITNDFKLLDLRYNHLTTLDNNFLQNTASTGMEMNLQYNNWFCTCEEGILQYFAANNVSLSQELICSSPASMKDMKFEQAIRECKQTETSTKSYSTYGTENYNTTNTKLYPTKPSSSTQPNTPTSSDEDLDFGLQGGLKLTPIECFRNDEKTDSYQQLIFEPIINFTLNAISSANLVVTIHTRPILPHFTIIYFTNYTSYRYKTDLKPHNSIDDLEPSTAFLICVLALTKLTVSPFNCQSYFNVAEKKQIWLSENDKLWLISLITSVAILLFLASVFMVYKLLACHPHWLLKRNKNRLGLNYSSGKVPKTAQQCNSEHQSPPKAVVSGKSLDYLNSHFPNIKQQDSPTAVYYSRYAVPLVRTPTPQPVENIYNKAGSSSFSNGTKRKTLDLQENGNYLDVIENDPDYQAID